MAGLSVAAVALPVSIAYAQLAGFDPVVGLYSSILPLIAYAIFGTSRQLMVKPDAAASAVIAAAIAPLARDSAELYLSLTVALTFLTGVFCIVASYFRLGALADFLSKPILVGFLNGIAISIFLGQIGKLLGFSVERSGIVPRLLEVLGKIPLIHGPTLMVGLGSFSLLFACLRWLPRLPAALAVLVVAGAMTSVLKLDIQGVAVLGPVPAGIVGDFCNKIAQADIRGDFGVPTDPINLPKSINRQRLFSARKRHESVPVRHFHFSQRLRVHRVVVCDDAVEVQDISDHRVDLVVGQ
jgi:MFS superfamily sulfate permease-like transporter